MSDNPESLKISRNLKANQSDVRFVQRNQLNTSISKMQYSIPKANRFEKQTKIDKSQLFYDLPELNNQRSTSFGYGNKVQIGKQKLNTPAPGTYALKSQFEVDKKKGITIGAGRQIVKSNSLFDTKQKQYIPGPLQYSPKYMQPSYSFSIGSKIVDKSDKWIKSVPGPGNYQTLELINKNLKNLNSKYVNCPGTRLGREKRKSQVQVLTRILKVPGPGQYNTVQSESLAKHRKYGGNRFSSSKRKGISDNNSSTPGPGSYKMFSDFIP